MLVRGGGASLANAFLTVLTKGVSPGPSPTFPFAWIPAPTLFSHRGCRRSGLGRPSSEPAPGGPCASPRRPPSRTSSGSPPCVLSFYQAKEQTPAVSSRRKPPPSRFGFKHEGPGGILLRFWSEDNDEREGRTRGLVFPLAKRLPRAGRCRSSAGEGRLLNTGSRGSSLRLGELRAVSPPCRASRCSLGARTISERQGGVTFTDTVSQEPTALSFGLVAVTKDKIFMSHSQ